METAETPRAKEFIFCLLICSARFWSVEADIGIEGSVDHSQSRFIYINCSFPKVAALGRSLALRRRVYSDNIFRTMTITNSTQVTNFFLGSTSITGFTFNGSVKYTFRRARCVDAGIYECRSVFSRTFNTFNREENKEVESLEMLPSVVRLSSQPKFLDFRHLVPGTLVKLQCSAFSTLPLENSWIWETAWLPNTSWSRVPDTSWTQERAPDVSTRCYVPWRTTLTLAVTEKDVDRAYRCYLHYNFKNETYNSSIAVYAFKDHQMEDSSNQVMLTILAMTFGTGIVILGGILMYRTFSAHFPDAWNRTTDRVSRFCCRQPYWQHRRQHSRSRGPVNRRGSQAADGGHHSPQAPSAGRENGQEKAEGSHTDNSADNLSKDFQSEDDSPGAEDECLDTDPPFADEGLIEVCLETVSTSSKVVAHAAASTSSTASRCAATPFSVEYRKPGSAVPALDLKQERPEHQGSPPALLMPGMKSGELQLAAATVSAPAMDNVQKLPASGIVEPPAENRPACSPQTPVPRGENGQVCCSGKPEPSVESRQFSTSGEIPVPCKNKDSDSALSK